MSCNLVYGLNNKLEKVVADNQQPSLLYKEAIKKFGKEMGLDIYLASKSDDFQDNIILSQNQVDENNEPKLNIVLNYLSLQNESKEPLTIQQKLDLKNISLGVENFSMQKLVDAFYSEGIFNISPKKLKKSGLYSDYEIANLANDVNLQEKVKQSLEALKNTEDFEVDVEFTEDLEKTGEINSFGKLTNLNPFIVQKEVLEKLAGTTEEQFEANLAELEYPNLQKKLEKPVKKSLIEKVIEQLRKNKLANNIYIYTNAQIEQKLRELGWNSNINKQIIGEKGASRVEQYQQSLNQAKQLEKDGIPLNDIEKQTGWYKFKGQWRKLSPEAVEQFKIQKIEKNKVLNLKEVIGNENILFKFYPELSEFKVIFVDNTLRNIPKTVPQGFNDMHGAYVQEISTLFINTRTQTPKQMEYTLAHESTHAIQRSEGFPQGGGDQSVLAEAMDILGIKSDNLMAIEKEIKNSDKTKLTKNQKFIVDSALDSLSAIWLKDAYKLRRQYSHILGEIDANIVEEALRFRDSGFIKTSYKDLLSFYSLNFNIDLNNVYLLKSGEVEFSILPQKNFEKADENLVDEYLKRITAVKQDNPQDYWSVDIPSREVVENSTIVKNEGGMALVTQDGNLIGLFKDGKEKGISKDLDEQRVALGGIKKDNYDGYLTKLYRERGFRVVARTAFDETYAQEGWNKELHGTPDVVAMIYDPQNKLNIEEKRFATYNEAIAYRDSFVNEARKNKTGFVGGGAAFANFFATITDTKDGGAEFKDLGKFLNKSIEGLEEELKEYFKYGGNFQKHIVASIPGFLDARIRMLRGMTDAAIVLGKDGKEVNMLDITSSEGYFTKAWAQLAQDKGVNAKADALDAGVTMQRDFNETPQVKGVDFLLEAWGETFVDPASGINIPLFVPTKKYEVVHENMGFQFFTPTRDKEIKEVKAMMSEGGLFVTAEKLKNEDYAKREILKDQYKAESFTETQMKEKAKTVLKKSDEASVGMMDYQFDRIGYEKVLSDNFKYVVQIWSSGNFAGYYASDSLEVINASLKGTGDTTTKYNEEVTPRVIQGDGLQTEIQFQRVADQLPLTLQVFERPEFIKLQGKQVNPITVLNSLNQSGIKQIERDLIKQVIEDNYKGQNKVDYDELEATVRANIMPLERITTSSYADYGMDNLGDGRYGEAKTLIFNAPIEHGVTGHFSGDFKASGRQNIKYQPKQLNDNTWVAVEEGYESQANDNNIYQYVGTAGTKEAVDAWIENYENAGKPYYTHLRGSRKTPIKFFDNVREAKIWIDRNQEKYTDKLEWEDSEAIEDTINKGMFGHIRVWEDDDTFYVAELQSDYFQKNNARKEILEKNKDYKNAKFEYDTDLKEIQLKKDLFFTDYQNLFLTEIEKMDNVEIKPHKLVLYDGTVSQDEYLWLFVNGEPLYKSNYTTDSSYSKEMQRTSIIKGKTLTALVDILGKETLEKIDNEVRQPVKPLEKDIKTAQKKFDNAVENIIKGLSPQEKQFIASQKIWEQRMVREAIKEASLSGATSLRFPTPYTLSVIEGYVEGSGTGNIQLNSEGTTEIGDTLEYLGEDYTIMSQVDWEDGVRIVRSSEVKEIVIKDFIDEMVANNMAEVYVEEGDKFYSKDTLDSSDAQRILDDRLEQKAEEEGTELEDTVLDITADIIEEIRESIRTRIKDDVEFDTERYFEDWGYENIVERDGVVYHTDAGVGSEYVSLKQNSQSKDEFSISDLNDTQQTVARKYEEIAELLKKEKTVEVVTDENGFDWYEAKITQEDTQKPVIAFQNTGVGVNTAGFTFAGDIYLNSQADSDTAHLHEFQHLHLDFLKANRPEVYRRGLSLIEAELEKSTRTAFKKETIEEDNKSFIQDFSTANIRGVNYQFLKADNVFYVEIEGVGEIAKATLNKDGYLDNIRVDEKYRRKGVGSALYDYVENINKKPLKPSPIKISKEARELWNKRGEVSEIQDVIDYVKRTQPSLTGEKLTNEILTELLGRDGLNLINELKDKKSGILDWLREVWAEIKNMWGISDMTDSEIMNLTLGEYARKMSVSLLKGEDIAQKYKNQLFQEMQGYKKAEVFMEVDGKIVQAKNTNTAVVLPLVAKQIDKIEDINKLQQYDLDILQANQQDTAKILKGIETKLIGEGIDVAGLADKEINVELMSFLGSLETFINNPTAENTQSFADVYDAYFEKDLSPKKEIVKAIKRQAQETDRDFVKLTTNLSEEEVYEQQGLIKVKDGLYIRTNKQDLDTLYASLETYKKHPKNTTLKEYVQNQISKLEYFKNSDNAEAVYLYKMYFDVLPTNSEDISYALRQIERGVLLWNGDITSPRIDLGITWADIRKGETDLRRGKVKSVPATRLVEALLTAKKEGGYRYKIGTGGENQRTATFISFEDMERSENEYGLTNNEMQQLNLEQEKIQTLFNVNFTGNYEYLTTEFVSDFYIEMLKEREKTSEIYKNFYSNFDVNENGIYLKNDDNITMSQIKEYADENLKQYSIISKQMPLLAEQEIKSETKQVRRDAILNSPQNLEKYQGQYHKLNDNNLILKNSGEEFIKVGGNIFEAVDTDGNLTLYSRLNTVMGEYNIFNNEAPKTDVKIEDYSYLNTQPEKFLTEKKYLTKSAKEKINRENFDCN